MKQQGKTVFLNGNGCGMKDLLRTKIFEDGEYLIKEFLKKDRILVLENEDMFKESLVMKVSTDTYQMSDEIATLLEI